MVARYSAEYSEADIQPVCFAVPCDFGCIESGVPFSLKVRIDDPDSGNVGFPVVIEIRVEIANMTNCLRIAALLTISACGLTASFASDGSAIVPESTGLETRWSSQAVLNPGRDKIRHVINDEELIFMQSTAGVVTAFNAENGRRMWASQIGRNDETAMGAITNKDTLLIIAGPVVYALNKFSGDEIFTYRLPAQPTATPGMDENSFFVPIVGGSLCAYSMKTLQYQEQYGKMPPGVVRPMAWRYFTGEQMRFPPVLGSDTIAVSTEKGSVHAVNLSGVNSGKSLYQLFLKSPISSPLTYVNGPSGEIVISTTDDNRIFCMELSKGAHMLWTYPMGRAITHKVIAVGETAFVVTDGGGVTALSVTTGLPVKVEGKDWHVPNIESISAVSKTRVYGIDTADRLVVIDRESMQLLERSSVNEFSHRLRNHLTDRVYLVSATGRVVCLAEKGSDFATYHQNPGRQPVMPELATPAASPAPAPAAGEENDSQ